MHTATPQLCNGRQTAIQSGIRKLSGLGRKLLLINGSKGMGQRPGEECCSNGQSRCCQRHCRNQAGPGPQVSRSRVAKSTAQEAGPHKQALRALAYSSAAGHLEDKWVDAACLPQDWMHVLILLVTDFGKPDPPAVVNWPNLSHFSRVPQNHSRGQLCLQLAPRQIFFFLKAHTKPKEEEQRAMKKPRYLPPSVSD